MFENIENLKIVSILQRANNPWSRVVDRKTHSLFIRVQGDMFYDFSGRQMVAKEGQLMFVPKGSTYFHKVMSIE